MFINPVRTAEREGRNTVEGNPGKRIRAAAPNPLSPSAAHRSCGGKGVHLAAPL